MQNVETLDHHAFQLVLRPGEALLAEHAPALRERFATELGGEGEGAVLLDLTGSERIDDAGIRLVIGCFRECQRRHRPFAVALGSPHLIQIFQAMQLHHHIDFLRVNAA